MRSLRPGRACLAGLLLADVSAPTVFAPAPLVVTQTTRP